MMALRMRRTGVQRTMPFLTALGMKPSSAALMRMLSGGAWAAWANTFSTSPTRIGVGIGQMEAVAVEPGLVRDVVHRIDHEVDRHDVDAPTLDADGRHPRRQQLRMRWISLKK